LRRKNARIKASRGRDNDSWVDAAGYSACGGELMHRKTE